MTKHFCYHHDDHDGLGAAYAVKQASFIASPETLEFASVNYGTDEYHFADFTNETIVIIVDFCPKPETIMKLCALVGRLIIIDHHKTSIADVEAFFASRAKPTNLEFVADVTMSGAELAWKHFHPGEKCPVALRYIGDYDMWKFELVHSREVNAWITAQPFTMQDMVRIAEALEDEHQLRATSDMGGAILQADRRYMEKMVKRTRVVYLDGYRGLMVNTTHLGSEMGNFILNQPENQPEVAKIDFAALTFEADGQIQVSLRSRKGGPVDVSAIAKKRGGGGHFNAARYSMPCTINLS